MVERPIDLSVLDPSLVSQEFDDLAPDFHDPLDDDDSSQQPSTASNTQLDPTAVFAEEASGPLEAQFATVNSSGNELPQAPAPGKPSRPRKKAASNKPATQPKKVVWTREMTDLVMKWFSDCRDRGLFNSTKKKDYTAAWLEVKDRCIERWPQLPWTTNHIALKYDTERRRFQLWKMLVDGYSGVTYDFETGLPRCSEATWEQFIKRNNTPSRSVLWLRTVPLGDVDVYRSVFFREQASGNYIAEAGDVEDGDDSGRDIADLLDDNDSDDDAIALETPVPKKRKLTVAQRRRLETDPDQTPEPESEASIAVSSSVSRKRVRDRDSAVLANTLRESVAILAAPRLAGADDLATAVEDIQKLFAEEVSEEELMNCIECLQRVPMRAVMWNKLSLTMKKLYVSKWKVGQD
ncbi:hypothetical protein C8A03DRAFT_18561 [Achaetomium macrosporum]|uniref:Myb/SANT-like domain-containing protein n=1 Tax=Achaetomium macrosporum TaxID=79813 RepID=A0AAN7H7U9_9PEZI|nr:hypothetical protein C8A03DRAFT_18561 [Achaetomium macrosporum]